MLGDYPDPRAVSLLIGLLGDNDIYLTKVAVNSLVRMGGMALNPLMKVINSGNPQVRAYACRALGELGNKGALKVLRAAAEDTDEKVKQSAHCSNSCLRI